MTTHTVEPNRPRLVTLGRIELLGTGSNGDALNKRRRKLAVLAYLVVAGRPVSRDTLLEMFWGSQPEERARHSLSDAISHLRRVLGGSAIVARQDEIAFDPSCRLSVDAIDLASAADRGDHARVIEMFAGEFLAGITVEDSSSFDLWLDRERERLRQLFSHACATECEALAQRGDWAAVTALARRWSEAVPTSRRAVRFLARAQMLGTEIAHRGADSDLDAGSHGRSPETLAAVEKIWERACAGRPQLLVVAEPAAERSGIRASLASRARADGATLLSVRAYAAEQQVTFGVLADLVRAMLDAPGLAGTDPASLAELSRLVPELGERFQSLRAQDSPTEGVRLRIFDAVRNALESLAFEAPVLVQLDNLRFADTATRAALHHVVRSVRRAPIAILVIATNEELRSDGAASRLIETAHELAPDDVRVFDAAPMPATTVAIPSDASEAPAITASDGAPSPFARVSRWVRRRPFVAVGCAAALLLFTAVLKGTNSSSVLAVGTVLDRTGTDTSSSARVLPELLATSLARVPAFRVLSRGRLYEGLSAVGSSGDSIRDITAAARAVGATELLEGALYRRGGVLHLDLREVELVSGTVRAAFAVEGSDAFALADSATASLARARKLDPPSSPLRNATSTSIAARRLYDEGLRAYYSIRSDRAHAYFEEALHEDSMFAMAAHYSALTASDDRDAAIQRALRLADRAGDRERLLIRGFWLLEWNDPRGIAAAETLAVRYPDDLAADLMFGSALEARGDFSGALAWLMRVAQRDSIGLSGNAPTCYACNALGLIKSTAMFAGSFRVAEDAARQLAGLYRDSRARATAWLDVALVRARGNQIAEARAAVDSASRYDPTLDLEYVNRELLVREGRFAEAEALIREHERTSGPAIRFEQLGNLVNVLRLEGRTGEALVVARQARALADSIGERDDPFSRLPIALAELSVNPRSAAAEFDSMAALPFAPNRPARNARHRAWMLTHAATALAASGDTNRLKGLADTIQRLGTQSDYARDQRLHHYVRGLLLEARGDTTAALDELLAARYSATETFFAVRLARAQLARHRPADAAATAAAALRGPLDSQNQYESRTELAEVLADALSETRDRSGAAEQYRFVASAWRHADPPFAARAARAARREAELRSGVRR